MEYDASDVLPGITPGSTSYFSESASELDPKLFQGTMLKSWVREGILSILFEYLSKDFTSPHQWVRAWLAGSGVSYQWAAQRYPGDLDCLVGIEYVKFRQANPDYSGYSNSEIAAMFNERFSADIMPTTAYWHGFELTYYVNPQTDIRDINPYAAYNLIADVWTIEPEKNMQPPYSRDWEQKSLRDADMATEIIDRYKESLNAVRSATTDAARVNAERRYKLAESQAIALFDEIHGSRKIAFSHIGSGYSDFNNYRWQAGKRSGIVQALRVIKERNKASSTRSQQEIYGVELPSADVLIRRSLGDK
jgi:hypothetical protein